MLSSLIERPPKGVATASELLKTFPERQDGWCLDALLGRYVEITGGPSSAALTAVRGMVLDAQRANGLVAWVGRRSSAFFPPDFAAAGVDLDALLVVFVDSVNEASRVVDLLFRARAFVLIVLDLSNHGELPMAAQSRFTALAKEHYTAFLEITRKDRDRNSRGSLASLRVEAKRERTDGELFCVEVRALKDKHSAPGWKHTESCHGPDGLC